MAMTEDNGQQEPSMEEILSSIRRIISDDGDGDGETEAEAEEAAPEPEAAEEEEPAGQAPAAEAADVEPVDLLEAAGAPVLKRLGPTLLAVAAVVVVVLILV